MAPRPPRAAAPSHSGSCRAPRRAVAIATACAALALALRAPRAAAAAAAAGSAEGAPRRRPEQEVAVNLHVHVDTLTDWRLARRPARSSTARTAALWPRQQRQGKDGARGGRADEDGSAVAAAAAATGRPGECKEFPKAFSTPYRVLAVGDFKGDLGTAQLLLRSLGVVDQADSWIATRTILVQLGGVLGRGPNGKTLYDFLFRLRAEAEAKDSHVELLLGSHEVMNLAAMTMSLEDIAEWKGGLDDFADDKPQMYTTYINDWDEFGDIAERKAAFSASGQLGSELRGMDIIFRLGPGDGLGLAHGITEGIIFMHADLQPELVIEFSSRCNCTGQALARYISRDFHGKLDKDTYGIASDPAVDGFLFQRELSLKAENPLLPRALDLLGATRVVLGRQPQWDTLIKKRYGGAVYLIDTAMSRWLNAPIKGRDVKPENRTPAPSALELGASRGEARALYPGRDTAKMQALWDALLERIGKQNDKESKRTFRCADEQVRDWTDVR